MTFLRCTEDEADKYIPSREGVHLKPLLRQLQLRSSLPDYSKGEHSAEDEVVVVVVVKGGGLTTAHLLEGGALDVPPSFFGPT